MKHFRKRKRIHPYIVDSILVVILVGIELYYASNRIYPVILDLVKSNVSAYNTSLLNEYMNTDLFLDYELDQMIHLVQNKEEEIIAVNYNMQKAYTLMKEIKKDIQKNEQQNMYKEYDEYAFLQKNKIILKYPLGIGSRNIFFNTFGTRIPIILYLDQSMITGFNTKVKNYGINNALVELYLHIEIKSSLISAKGRESVSNEYDVLVMSKLVVGSVPSYLNGNLESNSILEN